MKTIKQNRNWNMQNAPAAIFQMNSTQMFDYCLVCVLELFDALCIAHTHCLHKYTLTNFTGKEMNGVYRIRPNWKINKLLCCSEARII